MRNKDLEELKKLVRKQAKRLSGNAPAAETLTADELRMVQVIREKGITMADLDIRIDSLKL